jgi:hypothetical protein
LSRGSDPSGCPAEPLVSYRTNRLLSGWNLPPLMVRAFGAHGAQRTSAQRVIRSATRARDKPAGRAPLAGLSLGGLITSSNLGRMRLVASLEHDECENGSESYSASAGGHFGRRMHPSCRPGQVHHHWRVRQFPGGSTPVCAVVCFGLAGGPSCRIMRQ